VEVERDRMDRVRGRRVRLSMVLSRKGAVWGGGGGSIVSGFFFLVVRSGGVLGHPVKRRVEKDVTLTVAWLV